MLITFAELQSKRYSCANYKSSRFCSTLSSTLFIFQFLLIAVLTSLDLRQSSLVSRSYTVGKVYCSSNCCPASHISFTRKKLYARLSGSRLSRRMLCLAAEKNSAKPKSPAIAAENLTYSQPTVRKKSA
jgi:hypothetical protein